MAPGPILSGNTSSHFTSQKLGSCTPLCVSAIRTALLREHWLTSFNFYFHGFSFCKFITAIWVWSWGGWTKNELEEASWIKQFVNLPVPNRVWNENLIQGNVSPVTAHWAIQFKCSETMSSDHHREYWIVLNIAAVSSCTAFFVGKQSLLISFLSPPVPD